MTAKYPTHYVSPTTKSFAFTAITGWLRTLDQAKFENAISQPDGPEREWLIGQLNDVGNLAETMIAQLRGGVTDMDTLTCQTLYPEIQD